MAWETNLKRVIDGECVFTAEGTTVQELLDNSIAKAYAQGVADGVQLMKQTANSTYLQGLLDGLQRVLLEKAKNGGEKNG